MVTKLSQQDHTNGVAAALATTGLPVGRGIRNTMPDGTGEPIPPPCYIVHPIPGGRRYGTLDDHTKHADLVYQITCVGVTQTQAELVRDKSEVLLDGVTVQGRHVDLVRLDFGSDEARRDDSTGEVLFTATPRYRVASTPDSEPDE